MKKHAYLIMAFNHFELLKKIIHLIDDERNDIFIHVDEKAKKFNDKLFEKVAKKSKLIFINRKKVYWADYSQTNAELDLLTAACNKDSYHYYHLISGSDLPIKTQNEIHSFFDGKDNEFIGICPYEGWYATRRVKFYHPFTHSKIYRRCKPIKAIDRLLEYLQRVIGINRIKNKNIKFVDGWTWFSITDEFARYILSKRGFIEETFINTIASDELVFQTMIINNPDFYKRIYDNENLVKGSLRYIDWNRGRPYTFREDDFEELVNCKEAIFARKFDPNVDSKIIDMIYNYIDKKQRNGE